MRSVAAGLCHSDYHYLDGTLNRPRPVILGHEGAGIVEAVGPDVRDIQVGDHVVTCLVMGCGECVRCLAGEPTSCLNPGVTKRPRGHRPRLTLDGVSVGQMANVGSLADFILLDERAVTAVNTDIPMELACILGCAVVTGLGAVLNTADVQPGESVAVIGCGGVGLNVIQGARLAGAGQIIAIDANAGQARTRPTARRNRLGRCLRGRCGRGRPRDHRAWRRPCLRSGRSAGAGAPGVRDGSTWALCVSRRHPERRRRVGAARHWLSPRQEDDRCVHGRHQPPRRHPSLCRAVAIRQARPQWDDLAHPSARGGQSRVRHDDVRRSRPAPSSSSREAPCQIPTSSRCTPCR